MRQEGELQPFDLSGSETALEGGKNRVENQAEDDGAGQGGEQKSLGDSHAVWAGLEVLTHDTRLQQSRNG